jgi:hypothetical protein
MDNRARSEGSGHNLAQPQSEHGVFTRACPSVIMIYLMAKLGRLNEARLDQSVAGSSNHGVYLYTTAQALHGKSEAVWAYISRSAKVARRQPEECECGEKAPVPGSEGEAICAAFCVSRISSRHNMSAGKIGLFYCMRTSSTKLLAVIYNDNIITSFEAISVSIPV